MIDKRGREISEESRRLMGGITRFKPKHGLRNTVEYRIWEDMLNRCRNPKVESFKNYGGRGISVCNRWKNFENFINDVGERPNKIFSIDRIDNNGNYEPNNVRWILKSKQQSNTQRSVFVIYNTKRITATEFAHLIGRKPDTIRAYLRRGHSIEEAINKCRNIKSAQ